MKSFATNTPTSTAIKKYKHIDVAHGYQSHCHGIYLAADRPDGRPGVGEDVHGRLGARFWGNSCFNQILLSAFCVFFPFL